MHWSMKFIQECVVKVRIQYMYTINIKHHLLCLCPQVHIINLSSLTNIAKVCVKLDTKLFSIPPQLLINAIM